MTIIKQEKLSPTVKIASSSIYDIADYLSDIICEIDTSKHLKYLNKKGFDIFGTTLDDINEEQINFLDYIAPYDREKVDRYLSNIFLGMIPNPALIECNAIKFNKNLFPINIQIMPINLDNNSPGLRIIATEEKNSENRNLNVINKLIRIGTITNSLNDYFEFFLSILISEFNFSAGIIYLKDEKGSIARLFRHKNVKSKILDQLSVIRLKGHFFSSVLGDGVPILLNDIPKDTLNTFQDYASLYMFPFFSKGKILGGMLLLSEKRSILTNSEFSIFMSIGQEIGTLIEKIRLEEELYKLSLFALQSPDSIIITNLNGNIEYVNPTFTHLTGYVLEEVIDRNIEFLLTEESLNAINFDEIWSGIKSGNIKREYFQNKKKNGELYWEYVTFSPIINAQGIITSILSIHEDVTELKRTTEVLNTIISSIPAILIKINENGIITSFYGQKLRDFNLADNYAIGKSIQDIFPASIDHIRQALNGGKTRFIIDIELNNQQVFFSVDFLFDKINGKGAIGLAIDITEEKLAQIKLIESEKITALGEFIAGIAHEINNPLSYIKNNSELISNYYDAYMNFFDSFDQLISIFAFDNELKFKIDDLKQKFEIDYINKEFKDVLNENRTGLELIQRTVTDLRFYSKMDSEGSTHQRIDLNDIITSAIRMIGYKERNRITFEQNLAPNSYICGQVTKLSQTFLNLIKNASEAIPKKGLIRITSRKVGSQLEVRIWDNGTGIDPKIMPKIFKPFFTTKAHDKGTGLGLAICKTIIEEHKGIIYVQSEIGKFTEFIVTLPMN